MATDNASMVPCPHCGSHIKATDTQDHATCPFCGESLTTIAIKERSGPLRRLSRMGPKKRAGLIAASLVGIGAATWIAVEFIRPAFMDSASPDRMDENRTDDPGFAVYGGPPDPRNDEEPTAPQAVSPIDAGPIESPDADNDKPDAQAKSDEQ
jgi:hypothetical protein